MLLIFRKRSSDYQNMLELNFFLPHLSKLFKSMVKTALLLAVFKVTSYTEPIKSMNTMVLSTGVKSL